MKVAEILGEVIRRKSRPKLAIYHFDSEDLIAPIIIRALLCEALPSVDLGKGRSIIFHKAHTGEGQDHLHFRVKGATISSVNRDGSAHDRSHGIQLQRWATDGAKAHYPGMKMPPKGLIEQLVIEPDASQFLTEGAGPRTLIGVDQIQRAEEKAQQHGGVVTTP